MSGAPHTKGAHNGARLGDYFGLDQFIVGKATIGAAATTDVVTHGLSATPDFILISRFGLSQTWAANSTSVTITRTTSTAASVYSYIIGTLAS